MTAAPITGPVWSGSFAVAKATEERRFTLSALYEPYVVDGHGEFTTPAGLQQAAWAFLRKSVATGSTAIYRQHGDEIIGEVVEIVSWPFPLDVVLKGPDGDQQRTLPAGTTYVGIVWTPAAWPDVKKGKIRGLSLGGRARRVPAGTVPNLEPTGLGKSAARVHPDAARWGDRLAEARITKGFSQAGVADRLEVDEATVARWEAGDLPGYAHAPHLCRLLGFSWEQTKDLAATYARGTEKNR